LTESHFAPALSPTLAQAVAIILRFRHCHFKYTFTVPSAVSQKVQCLAFRLSIDEYGNVAARRNFGKFTERGV